jgi:hypothetical protein
MSDLTAAYDRLARGWTHEELAGRYRDAKRRGEQLPEKDQDHLIRRPIAMLASAVPACASLSVAIHVIHVLPATGPLALRDQLLRNAENNSAVALHRCHQALELDGQAHDYSPDEWLPAVYDIAGPLLETARLNPEPPSLVEQAQEAVRWLSRAIVDLDEDSPDAAAAPRGRASGACSRSTSSLASQASPQTNSPHSLSPLQQIQALGVNEGPGALALAVVLPRRRSLRRARDRIWSEARADPTALQRVLVGDCDHAGVRAAATAFVAKGSPGAGDRHDRGVAIAIARCPAGPRRKGIVAVGQRRAIPFRAMRSRWRPAWRDRSSSKGMVRTPLLRSCGCRRDVNRSAVGDRQVIAYAGAGLR